LLLYLTHAAASILVGILFRFHGGRDAGREKRPVRATFETVRASSAFTGAVVKALQSTLSICAFVVFFSVVLELLSAYGVLAALAQVLAMFGVGEEWARRLVAGLLELSSGVSSLTGGPLSGRLSMAAFMLGWAGLSVHCQVLAFLGDSGLSMGTYLWGKLLHGLFSAALLPELEALTGDQGGRVVLRRHWDRCILLPAEDPLELADADTPEALLALRQGESDTFEPS